MKKLYQSHRPTDEGYNTFENFDTYRLKVQNLQPTTTIAQFQSWVNQAKQDKSWLILVYHKITDTNPDKWDSTKKDFQTHLTYLKNAGMTVKTMKDAIYELSTQVQPGSYQAGSNDTSITQQDNRINDGFFTENRGQWDTSLCYAGNTPFGRIAFNHFFKSAETMEMKIKVSDSAGRAKDFTLRLKVR